VFCPQDKFFAGIDGSVDVAADVTSSNGKTGSGECLPKWPEGGSVPVATTSRRNDLQAHDSGSRPVENSYGNHVDTNKLNAAQEIKGKKRASKKKGNKVKIVIILRITNRCHFLQYFFIVRHNPTCFGPLSAHHQGFP